MKREMRETYKRKMERGGEREGEIDRAASKPSI